MKDNRHTKKKRLFDALRNNLKRRKQIDKKTDHKKNATLKRIKHTLLILIINFSISCNVNLRALEFSTNRDIIKAIEMNAAKQNYFIDILGKPLIKSVFGPKVLFYIEKKYYKYTSHNLSFSEQNIVAFELNYQNIVKSIYKYPTYNNHFIYDYYVTVVKDNKISILEQVIKNIGKFHSKAQLMAS